MRSGGSAPSRHEFLGFLQKKTLILSVVVLSKSGLNPPLLALLVDSRYSISILVCRRVVTENISGGGAIAPFAAPLPGYAPDHSHKFKQKMNEKKTQQKYHGSASQQVI